MSVNPIPRLSPQEYLRRERLATERSEYRGPDGIVAMSGASRKHNRIVVNVSVSLANQLRDRPCNNYSNDLRVSVRGGERYFYPDVVVTCGKEVFEDTDFDTLVNPVVVIEVLSSSTEAYDRGGKFFDYQTIPSLQEYVLITQSPRRFEVYRRQADGSWLYQSWPFSPPPLVLQSIDCTLSADEVYFKVEPDNEPEAGAEGAQPGTPGHATGAAHIDAITPTELKARIDRGDPPFILDVRNPDEIAICRIAGSTVIPLPELPERLGELDTATPMVVHCKSGARSQKAIAVLEQAGFTRLHNLTGGILAWIKDVDPSLQAY